MEALRKQNHTVTLVDQVEDKLLSYFQEKNIGVGDSIPNELELAATLGVARSVLREALSRLKMMGLVESRTRRGMLLCEPSLLRGMKRVVDPRILGEETLFNLLKFRIALELGICNDIFERVTDEDIEELEEIVKVETAMENNVYTPISEFSFHAKLCKITGNEIIMEFQQIIHPIMIYVKDKFKEQIESINMAMKEKDQMVTHFDLLSYIKIKDLKGYCEALKIHFDVYKQLERNKYYKL